MKKLALSVLTLMAVFAATLPALAAEEEKEKKIAVPVNTQVTDPPGDANAQGGDWQTGNAPIDGADILKAWFTNDPETVTAFIQTDAPFANDAGLLFRVMVNPKNALSSTSTSNCIWFEAGVSGAGNPVGNFGRVQDRCGAQFKTTAGEVSFSDGPDGTGILAITVPRTASPAFEEGSVLFVPFAESRQYIGVLVALLDNTKTGGDFTLVGPVVAPKKEEPKEEEGEEEESEEGEEGEEGEEEEEESVSKPAPKKKKKGKKSKGSCPAFVPSDDGKEAETTLVPATATEEKPVEVKIEVPAGVPVAQSHVFHNVQADTSGGTQGLFVRYEFPSFEDNDLYLYDAAGEEVAQAAGFNPAPVGPLDDTSGGGHSERGAEQIDGLATADCGGYTVELAQYLSEGGEMTLKLWLGEAAKAEG